MTDDFPDMSCEEWKCQGLIELRRLAEFQDEITSDDLHPLIGEPLHHNQWGALLLEAGKQGIIRRTGRIKRSTRPLAKGRQIQIWEPIPRSRFRCVDCGVELTDSEAKELTVTGTSGGDGPVCEDCWPRLISMDSRDVAVIDEALRFAEQAYREYRYDKIHGWTHEEASCIQTRANRQGSIG